MAQDTVDKKQALSVHLKALRRVLIVSFAAIAVCFAVLLYGFCEPLVTFILRPVTDRGIATVSTAVSDALVMKFKICLIGGIVLAVPVIIWQIWGFIAPALYPREKKLFAGLFFCMLVLFVIGVCFCYIVILPLTVDLFMTTASDSAISNLWNVNDYFDFVLSFVLPFGIMFELPVAMFMLAKKGKIRYETAAKARKYVILVIAVLAAILTPPDVVSQIMLMVPMIALYELSVQIIRLIKPKSEENAG